MSPRVRRSLACTVAGMNITPCIAFNDTAEQAAEFYAHVFSNHTQANVGVTVPGEPGKPITSTTINIGGANVGMDIVLINLGDSAKLTPANSFMVNFDPATDLEAEQHLRQLWEALSDGGTMRMPLQDYPFSPLFGWIEDKFGLNWQLMLTSKDASPRPHIVPCFLFTDEKPQVKAAIEHWGSFLPFEMGALVPSPEDASGDTVLFSDFRLVGDWFNAMDGGSVHQFGFENGFSLMVNCDNQEQVDRIWEGLSADPAAEQSGWLKDKFGFSWQILPPGLLEKLQNPENVEKVLQMKKLDLAEFD